MDKRTQVNLGGTAKNTLRPILDGGFCFITKEVETY